MKYDMDINEDMLANLYRQVETKQITQEQLSQYFLKLGYQGYKVLAELALEHKNGEAYQIIVLACNDALIRNQEKGKSK